MIKHLLLWFFGYCTFSITAQTITIIDIKSGEPLIGVNILCPVNNQFFVTDERGKADISSCSGAKSIEFNYLGYKTRTLSYAQLKDSRFSITMTPNNLQLEEIVISATRWRQSSGNIPAKVITVSPEQVTLQNPQTAADLLSLSGKVFIQKSQQGGGSPMIRGFATNRLIYTVDGIRMNNAIYRGGNIQNVINLDPFAVESTEIVFGPGSVLYGSDAIGGVMSFKSLTPKLSTSKDLYFTGKVISRYSSANNEKTGHADINIGGDTWAILSSISYWDYDHLKQGSRGPDDYLKPYYVERRENEDVIVIQENPLLQRPSGYDQLNLMQKIKYQPSDNLMLIYGLKYSETSAFGRYDRHNRILNNQPRYGEWKYGPQKWMMNHVALSHSSRNKFYDQLSLKIAIQSFEESRISRNFNALIRTSQIENVDAYSINFDFIKKYNNKNRFIYGAEYVYNKVISVGEMTNIMDGEISTAPARYPESNWTSTGLFLNHYLKISDRFSMQSGIRLNFSSLDANFSNNQPFFPLPFEGSSQNNTALTGSIGGVLRPDNNTVIKANIGTAFRSPNVDDIGKIFDSEPGAVTVPNPNLKPEYAYNFDVSMAKIFSNHVKFDITLYYTYLNDALVRRGFLLNGRDSIEYDGILSQVQAIQNASKATTYGIQTGLEYKISPSLSFLSDFNWQYGQEELDNGIISPSRHAAPVFGTNRLQYSSEKLTVELSHQYQGERSHTDLAQEEKEKDEIYAKDENGNNYAPSWYTFNIKATFNIDEVISLNFGIENITNQRYRPYSSGISGPGRNIITSIQFGF